MPDAPLLSVVIPCLDQAHFLRQALRSVAAQTWRPIETIVVDDGSTDDTATVARDAGVILLQQPNAGVSAARNLGLRAARGEFVIFLDADDELEPDAAATGVEWLEQHPSAWMVARCCVLIDSAGDELPTNCPSPVSSEDPYPELLERNYVWTPGAAVFRRTPFLALGGFPANASPAADYAVYLELARARRVVFDPHVAVRYRQHESNMSRDAATMLRATLTVLRGERSHMPAASRPQYQRAVRTWCTYYGEQIIQQMRFAVRSGGIEREQWRDMWLLLTACPSLVLRHFVRKAGRVLGGHPPAPVEAGRFAPGHPRRTGQAGSAGVPR